MKINMSKVKNKETVEETKMSNNDSEKVTVKKSVEKSDNGNKIKSENNIDESKYDTVSLKEIRDALETKVNDSQKKNVIKEVIENIFIAIIMITYLILVMMGSKNIDIEIFEKDIKVLTLSMLAIGIFIIEISYKKDSTKLIMHGIEVLVFGAANLCLIYVLKLYFDNFINVLTYIGIAVSGYYILKSIILAIADVKNYKKDNNDISEIVKKEVKEI